MNNIIEGTRLADMCDYSFGDQASVICHIPGGYMKDANITNIEFIEKMSIISKERNYMTLFIDNIRLYKRDIVLNNEFDQNWVNKLMYENDLLKLCSQLRNMNFIIFTNLEDTPIDSHIEGNIPSNVLSINAVNAIYNNNKVKPFPYGLQRRLNTSDNRSEIILEMMNIDIDINNLLYINHNISTNKERVGLSDLFIDEKWVNVNSDRVDYKTFLTKIKETKFMICPVGNAIDCHRNWEVLYMRRVPIMKKNDYLIKLFSGFPVLFVDEYSDVTEELLIVNDNLYQDALNLDLDKLNLDRLFNIIIKENLNDNN